MPTRPARRSASSALRGLLAIGIASVALSGMATAGTAHVGSAGAGAIRLVWHLLPNTTSPTPRDRVGFTYDPSDNYSVLYGGYDASSYFYDTYRFLAGNWTLLSPASHPTAATGLRLAYDPGLHGVLAFGGEGPYGSAHYNDTWLFQSGNWTLLSPKASPSPRAQYAMAYDAADSEMVLFGGFTGSSDLADTWTFNGTTWTHVTPAKTPEGREQASMVYDAASSQVLLFGGWNKTSGQAPSGTWAFHGGAWKHLPNTHTPLRSWTPVTTLPSGTPIFFGGELGGQPNILNTTYEFLSGAWHKLPTRNTPLPRANGGITYDVHDGYLVYFGGIAPSYSYLNETWKLG
ncbi:MAG: kelch repeat-containing protein [Thermoplasmata archaeon]|nr:kelch repeat-containing protein [Thermoplasmata archaeon]